MFILDGNSVESSDMSITHFTLQKIENNISFIIMSVA